MDWISLMEAVGEQRLLAAGGLLIGLAFGYFAQRSRFCLRSATIEVSRGVLGAKLSVWLFAFSAAVVMSQAMMLSGALDVSSARQLTARGSLSGAAIGGLLFGIGMVLARGCASRLLVLAANGNLRALLSGLVFAVTAQSALDGALSPLRQWISTWWTIEGSARDMLAWFGAGHLGGLLFGMAWLALAAVLAIRHRLGVWGRLARQRWCRPHGCCRLVVYLSDVGTGLRAGDRAESVFHRSLRRSADAGSDATRSDLEL